MEILIAEVFLYNILNILLHTCPACVVSEEKLDMILTFDHL